MPSIEIDLKKIFHNVIALKKLLDSKKISIIGITKGVLGDPEIANTMIRAGILYLGDSRIENIIKMRKANIPAKFVLIRNPTIKEIPLVVSYTEISLNSELDVIQKLSDEAIRQNKIHGIILMVEMGDLREGIMPEDLTGLIKNIIKLEGITIRGIGTNMKCFGGVIPDEEKMKQFSNIAENIQKSMNLNFEFVSAGNSANLDWVASTNEVGAINNLRLGTAIILGAGGILEEPISGLYQDAFTLMAEIVELKKKPFYPEGKITTNAFGEISVFEKNPQWRDVKGSRNQALLNIGRQDIQETGLLPKDVNLEILGATSDYLVVDLKSNERFKIGEKIQFNLNYEALLRAMTSPYVIKIYI